MQDLKYEAITIEPAYREILDSLKTSDLTAVTAAFITNVDRVYGLLQLPIAIPHLMGMLVNAILPVLGEVLGEMEVGSQFTVAAEEVQKTAKEFAAAIVNIPNITELPLETRFDLVNAKLKTLSDENSDTARRISAILRVIVNMMKGLTITMDKSGKPSISLKMTETEAKAWSKSFGFVINIVGAPARVAFDGLLTGSIVGTWTAIEALAGDLWEAALNAKPEILSKLNGLHRKKEKNESSKQIDLTYIHRYEYSLRHVMGTILRRRFAFASLDGIKEAYGAAFSKDGTAVLDVIKDRALFRLSCVRNVIVHRGGLVDEEFHDKMKKDARFSGLQIGEAITIDGEATNELIGPAVRCGVGLIEAVDHWLESHPGKVR